VLQNISLLEQDNENEKPSSTQFSSTAFLLLRSSLKYGKAAFYCTATYSASDGFVEFHKQPWHAIN
jgi:hypothetical protein